MNYTLCGYGFQKIATHLDKNYIITPSRYMNLKHQIEKWNPKTIRAILINEVYIGNTVQNKATTISYKIKKKRAKSKEEYIRVEDTHKAIISKELFYAVQEIMKNKKTVSSPKHNFLFKGLLFCHNCGRKSRVCYRGNKNKIGYIDCSLARSKDKKCITCNYNYNRFEEKTLNFIRDICKNHADKEQLKNIYKLYEKNFLKLILKEESKKGKIQGQIQDISNKLHKIYMDNLNDIITDTEYIEYSKKFRKEKEKMLEIQNKIENKISEIKKNQKELKSNNEIENIVNEFLQLEYPSKEILYKLINRVELDEYKNIYIYFNFKEVT